MTVGGKMKSGVVDRLSRIVATYVALKKKILIVESRIENEMDVFYGPLEIILDQDVTCTNCAIVNIM